MMLDEVTQKNSVGDHKQISIDDDVQELRNFFTKALHVDQISIASENLQTWWSEPFIRETLLAYHKILGTTACSFADMSQIQECLGKISLSNNEKFDAKPITTIFSHWLTANAKNLSVVTLASAILVALCTDVDVLTSQELFYFLQSRICMVLRVMCDDEMAAVVFNAFNITLREQYRRGNLLGGKDEDEICIEPSYSLPARK
jgi:hypothetical protein